MSIDGRQDIYNHRKNKRRDVGVCMQHTTHFFALYSNKLQEDLHFLTPRNQMKTKLKQINRLLTGGGGSRIAQIHQPESLAAAMSGATCNGHGQHEWSASIRHYC